MVSITARNKINDETYIPVKMIFQNTQIESIYDDALQNASGI